jgi:CubicO group peptidase (beta-lactamase class C family)/dienelactone hydrolase
MRYAVLLGALLWTIGLCCGAQAKIIQEEIAVPVEVADANGQLVRQPIKVTIFRDDARARSPFLILNHGRSSDPAKRAATRPAQFAANARYFASLGFAVFFPVRIGNGATAGPDLDASGPCRAKDYRRSYEVGVVQSEAVIARAKSLHYVDPAKGIVLGQSYGGTLAITLAAKRIEGVFAAVNFAGGGGGRPLTHPGEPCGIDRMTELFAAYGAEARIPTLWFYSENDKYWGRMQPRKWHKAFTEKGGQAEFIELPSYKENGHPIFTGIPESWKPAFERFIETCCKAVSLKRPAEAATPVPADIDGTPAIFTKVLANWAAKHNVKRAVIVVRRDGRVVHQAGLGGADPAAPVHLASLSKAITGACIATLIRDSKLSLDTPLSTALAKFFNTYGRPADRRIERVTIAQLLTHRAGFPGPADGGDLATGALLKAYRFTNPTREPPKPGYLASILAQHLHREPGQQFAYSNSGYLVLGAVVEEAAGRPYAAHCRDAVLTSAGAVGMLDPQWAVLWSTGGWSMTGADYLAFFDQLDPARAKFGPTVRNWMLDPSGKTIGTSKSPSWYGLGARIRGDNRSRVISHTGSWRATIDPRDPKKSGISETSTLAIRSADGTSWFVHNVPRILDGARAELERELLIAHRSVRTWR